MPDTKKNEKLLEERKPIITGITDFENENLKIERKKLELEKEKFDYAKISDEKKLKSDRSTKLWTQFTILIPLVIFLSGFFLTSYLDKNKREWAQKEEIKKFKRQFIEKQMAEFYYPIQLRLNKDDAYFVIRRKLDTSGNANLSKKIEEELVFPNQNEIIKIIDDHFDLIKNEDEEDKAVYPLMEAIKAYERHIAVYKALKSTGDLRVPLQLHEKYPKEFFAIIDKRIAELENQRDDLLVSF